MNALLEPPLGPTERARLCHQCQQWLVGHPREGISRTLADLAVAAEQDLLPDLFGRGELQQGFEAQMAGLLGKPAALFMPSGTMAQQIALRLHAERAGQARVAFHPLSHLEVHEYQAYAHLHGLEATLVGPPDRLLQLDDLEALPRPPAALLLELPQRDLAGRLPSWAELEEIRAWARRHGTALHLDGARLWECQPFYGRSLAEICALFDTVYVSFYKTLGGIAGAMLLGPGDLMREARVWQRRHGGDLVRMYPYVLSARQAYLDRSPRVARYCEKARRIARALKGLDGVRVEPDPPHVNLMHVHLAASPEALDRAALELARERRIWLANGPLPPTEEGWSRFELTVGDGALELDDEEIRALVSAWLARARGCP